VGFRRLGRRGFRRRRLAAPSASPTPRATDRQRNLPAAGLRPAEQLDQIELVFRAVSFARGNGIPLNQAGLSVKVSPESG
jgi:hypothetical protein